MYIYLILGGDINCALSPLLGKSASLSKSAHSIQLFLKAYGVAQWSPTFFALWTGFMYDLYMTDRGAEAAHV